MRLVLALPGLAQITNRADAHAPRLARLVATAGPVEREPEGQDAMLATNYGIEHAANTDCPLAPIRLAALGVDPGTAFWLCADPVTLVAGRDDVRLAGVVRDLDPYDAVALVRTLNAHFVTDGIEFVAARPDAWFVRASSRVALKTRPLAAVTGRMLRHLLPTGPDSGTWRRWQNEIQMLMHAHPVNEARARDGKDPANSVWFSEGGTLSPYAGNAVAVRTFAESGIATALAAHAGRPACAVPAALDRVLADCDDATVIVVVLAAKLDLERIESAWTAPAWTALVKGVVDAVTLIADGDDGAVAWNARRPGPGRRIAAHFSRPDLAPFFAATRGQT